MDIKALQQAVSQRAEEVTPELVSLSQYLHKNPEIPFQEVKACAALVMLMEKHGFTVETNCCDISTAFKARYRSGKPGPRIAFMAEYDALKGLGHACGHNIIAASSAGAAISLKSVLEETGGEILLIGTPGEEGDGGKVFMADRGAFDDVDFALMMHPTTGTPKLGKISTACCDIRVFFTGKDAHSSRPENGINALTAAIQTFNNIDKVRPLFALKDNINGVILDGGNQPNIIPGKAVCAFTLRSLNLENLERLIRFLEQSVSAAETLTGAKARFEFGGKFAEYYPNRPMLERFKLHGEELGETFEYADQSKMSGSSDVGNVSVLVPTIQEYLSIGSEDIIGHSPAFAEAACSELGNQVCGKGAKVLALTGLDLLVDEDLRRQARECFEEQVPASYRKKK